MSDDIRAFFHAEWAEIAPAWLRWGEAFRRQTRAATDLVLELGQIGTGMRVLDLASGTGEPALEIAARVGAAGRVTATDMVPGALQLCAAEARRRGLAQLRTVEADMESLPFAAASFEAVSCRLGIMFCRDIDRALSEVRRVLCSSGVATFIVWGDGEQPLFDCTLSELGRPTSVPAESADDPGPFRFSRPRRLAATVERAGFREVREARRVVPWPWPGSAAEMWTAFVELAGASFAAEVAGVARDRPDVHERIIARLRKYERAGCVNPTAELIGVCGRV